MSERRLCSATMASDDDRTHDFVPFDPDWSRDEPERIPVAVYCKQCGEWSPCPTEVLPDVQHP